MRILIPLVLVVLLVVVVRMLSGSDEAPSPSSLSLADALGTDIDGYDRAFRPRPITFPSDHGPHPGFKLEWWYLTGNLNDTDGHPFGYQVTIFRNALAPPDSISRSGWATRQLYVAHVALTDGEAGTYVSDERIVRPSGGAAGAAEGAMDVWVGPVSIRGVGAALDTVFVEAPIGEGHLSLTLVSSKPIVLQGDEGFSPKGDEPGNASYYYSVTRFNASGQWTGKNGATSLSGTSWLDREWSTSLLGRTQTGWDWFSLQLEDGSDLMFFTLREDDPSIVPYRDGVLVRPSGERIELDVDALTLSSSETWTSSGSGATYPSRWRLTIPEEGMDLTINPILPDQEFNAAIRYWEGAVRVSGTHSGRGYVELTGYDQAP